WVVGDQGVIAHYDGTSWSLVSVPYINSLITVWGAASKDVWIGGELGLLLRWDGSKLSEFSSGGTDTIWLIRGTSATSAFMLVDGEDVNKWDGTSWTANKSLYTMQVSIQTDGTIWAPRTFGATSDFWTGTVWSTRNYPSSNPGQVFVTGSDGWTSDGASGTL